MKKRLLTFGTILILLASAIAQSATQSGNDALDKPAPAATESTTVKKPAREIIPTSAGLNIQYVPISYSHYLWNGQSTNNHVGDGLMLSAEWLPIVHYGKLGIGLGLGYYILRNVQYSPTASATLNTFPIESYLTYRFDYTKNQILVPFIQGGPSIVFAGQTNSHASGPQTFKGLDYAAGVELGLNALDPTTARDAAYSLGIHNTYVIFEYLRSDYLGTPPTTGPDLIHAEYRIGLRFEM